VIPVSNRIDLVALDFLWRALTRKEADAGKRITDNSRKWILDVPNRGPAQRQSLGQDIDPNQLTLLYLFQR
jgi:hypothetical protein